VTCSSLRLVVDFTHVAILRISGLVSPGIARRIYILERSRVSLLSSKFTTILSLEARTSVILKSLLGELADSIDIMSTGL
jgi:hypothetical protein